MSGRPRTSIAIIGGGASGVILAMHLLRSPRPDLRVTLIEKRDRVGRGMAYSTTSPDHRLNVPASRMSAFADQPTHFLDWLAEAAPAEAAEPGGFVARSLYGRYLAALVEEAEAREGPASRFRVVAGECVSVSPTSSGVSVELADGVGIACHAAILAVGHDPEPAPQFSFAVKSGSPADTPLDADAAVLILGTGLSMIDVWLTLEAAGHRGPIVALSRRGLIPQAYGERRSPVRLDLADIPLGTELSYFARWFHELIEATEQEGGDWRDVIDGLRPFNQRIWQDWPVSARRRFLEHTRAWWDVHRHRLAPDLHARALEAIAAGRLSPVAGRLVGVEQEGDGFRATIRRRGARETETLEVARVYDCTGITRDVSTGSIGVVRSLTDRGLARPDPLRLGLDVTADCAVIARDGAVSDRLFAVGPLTRGTFFEIDAIPEIRLQCARLATALTG